MGVSPLFKGLHPKPYESLRTYVGKNPRLKYLRLRLDALPLSHTHPFTSKELLSGSSVGLPPTMTVKAPGSTTHRSSAP